MELVYDEEQQAWVEPECQEAVYQLQEAITDLVGPLPAEVAGDLLGQLVKYCESLRADVDIDRHQLPGQVEPVAKKVREPAGLTLELEWVRCGKERCKTCNAGKGHGPYWYGYYRTDGKLKKRYIGKDLGRVSSAVNVGR